MAALHLCNFFNNLAMMSVCVLSCVVPSHAHFSVGLLPSASVPGNGGFELGNLETWKIGNIDI